MPEGSIKDGIGASVRRKEDKRFLTGSGRYTADISRPGQLHVHFVRSVHAHANIKAIRTAAAEKADGVVAVFTGEHVAADGIGGPICGWVVTNRDGSPTNEPPHPILANGKVNYVGDHVVAVIAESLEQAMNAAELVEIDYEVLAPVVDLAAAGAGEQIHENVPGNMYFDFELGDESATQSALDSAATIVELEVRNNRLIPNAMEPRAALAEYDPIDEAYTLFTTSQNPHLTRLVIGAFMLSIPESKLRVVAPDVGGGFGSKIYVYPEEAVCTWASKKLQRPIKWTADRSDPSLPTRMAGPHQQGADGTGQGQPDHRSSRRQRGQYRLLPVRLLCCDADDPACPAAVGLLQDPGHLHQREGHGDNHRPGRRLSRRRPSGSHLSSGAGDGQGGAPGRNGPGRVPPDEFHSEGRFPYQTPVALQYDIGDYEPPLDKALDMIDYKGFEARRAEAASRGKYRGIGLSSYIEACGIAPSAVAGALGARVGLYESATVRVDPTGTVNVFTGTHSHGQGHDTTFAQIVADKLGVDIGSVQIIHGDSDKIPFGMEATARVRWLLAARQSPRPSTR